MSGLVFIVNSRSKPSQQAQFTRALLTHLADKKHQVYQTEYAGHAEVLAREAVANNAAAIIAVGGDGTVNEVLQGIGNSGIPLGIIPMGSGNGLARHIGISLNPMDAMATLVQGEQQAIDLGQVNDYYFISNCGFGFDAHVAEVIKNKERRGLRMYIQETTKHFFKYKPQTFTLTLNKVQTLQREAFMVNIANGREFGYGFTIAPQASLQDGVLDVLIVKPFPWYRAFGLVWDAWRGQWHRNPFCEHIKATEVHIQHTHALPMQTDGDARSCKEEYTIFVHRAALQLIVPRGTRNI